MNLQNNNSIYYDLCNCSIIHLKKECQKHTMYVQYSFLIKYFSGIQLSFVVTLDFIKNGNVIYLSTLYICSKDIVFYTMGKKGLLGNTKVALKWFG